MRIAEVVRLESYPCYLIVLVGSDGIAKALDKLGMKYTDHERDVEFDKNPMDMAFVLELEKCYRPNTAQKLLDWHSAKTYLIWLNCTPRTNRHFSTVAHECIHLKNYILKYIGQKRLSLVDDENEANVYDFLFRKVLDVARPTRRKK